MTNWKVNDKLSYLFTNYIILLTPNCHKYSKHQRSIVVKYAKILKSKKKNVSVTLGTSHADIKRYVLYALWKPSRLLLLWQYRYLRAESNADLHDLKVHLYCTRVLQCVTHFRSLAGAVEPPVRAEFVTSRAHDNLSTNLRVTHLFAVQLRSLMTNQFTYSTTNRHQYVALKCR